LYPGDPKGQLRPCLVLETQNGSEGGFAVRVAYGTKSLEPIQEVEIHEQRLGLVKRLSMMRIMARRMKAATVLA
jgi:hypothetical protein